MQSWSLSKVGPLSDLVGHLLYYARVSEQQRDIPTSQTEVLDALKDVLEHTKQRFGAAAEIFNPAPASWRVMDHVKIHRPPNRIERSFLALAVRAGLRKYIEETIDEDLNEDALCSLTRSALLPTMISSKAEVAIDIWMSDFLLRQSKTSSGSQGWSVVNTEFMGHIAPVWETLHIDDKTNRLRAIKTIQDCGKLRVDTHRIHERLLWVDILLMDPTNWTNRSVHSTDQANWNKRSADFADMACSVIEHYIHNDNSVNTNEIYKGSTIWGHFVRNLPRETLRPTKLRLLSAVQTFLEAGADRKFCYSLPPYDYRAGYRCKEIECALHVNVKSRLEQTFTVFELGKIGFTTACQLLLLATRMLKTSRRRNPGKVG